MTWPLTFTLGKAPFLLDEQLEAVRPSCEWWAYNPRRGEVVPVVCDQPASWLLRALCGSCHRPDIQLVCDNHNNVVQHRRTTTYCPGCKQLNVELHTTAEPLQ